MNRQSVCCTRGNVSKAPLKRLTQFLRGARSLNLHAKCRKRRQVLHEPGSRLPGILFFLFFFFFHCWSLNEVRSRFRFGVFFFPFFFSPPPPIFSYRSREERSRQKTTARSNYFSFRLDVEKRNRSGVFPLVVFFREIFRLKRVKGNHAENQYDRILHSSRSFGLFVSNTRRKTIAEWLYDRVLQSSYFCFLFFFFRYCYFERTEERDFTHFYRQFPLQLDQDENRVSCTNDVA